MPPQPNRPPTNAPSSPFLRLPPSIRLKIYSHLFHPSPIHLLREKSRVFHVRCPSPPPTSTCPELLRAHRQLHVWGMARDNEDAFGWGPVVETRGYLSLTHVGILRACRQVYEEALEVLYGLTFHVGDLETWRAFVGRLGQRSVAAMRDVRVGWREEGFGDALSVDLGADVGGEWRGGRGVIAGQRI